MDTVDKSKFITKLSDSGRELLKRGLKLIGPSTGAYLGALTNDPTAIVLSAAVGDALSQNINDFAERALSEKEKNNISITEAFSIAKILENQETKGDVNEKYLNEQTSGNAYELYHGILNAAKNNYEDKKLEFIGRFYGNIIFASDIEPQLSHFLLSTLKSLNYKQICILSIVGQPEKYLKDLTSIDELAKRQNWYETYIVQNELSNMMLNGLLIPHNEALLTHVGKRHLDKCRLSTIGQLLFAISEFDKVDENDLTDLVKFFK